MATGSPGICIWTLRGTVWTGDGQHCATGCRCQDVFEGRHLDKGGVEDAVFRRLIAQKRKEGFDVKEHGSTVELPCVRDGPTASPKPTPPPKPVPPPPKPPTRRPKH